MGFVLELDCKLYRVDPELQDDNSFDKAGMAEEAHRVAQNLAAAAAAGGFGATPLPGQSTACPHHTVLQSTAPSHTGTAGADYVVGDCTAGCCFAVAHRCDVACHC